MVYFQVLKRKKVDEKLLKEQRKPTRERSGDRTG